MHAERLLACLAALEPADVDAEGMIGDADPLQAALDALALFPADEIVVATHPKDDRTGSRAGSSSGCARRATCPCCT